VKRAGLLVALAACSGSVRSSDVTTSGIFATFRVTTTATAPTTATATFRVKNATGDFIELDAGDQVAADGTQLVLAASADELDYVGTVANGGDHAFAFTRHGEDPIDGDVPSPTAFSLTSGPFDGTYDLEPTLTWSPIDRAGTITIAAKGTVPACADVTLVDTLPDTGSFAFAGVDLAPSDMSMPDCTYTLSVSRDETSPITAGAGGVQIARHVEATTISLRAF
jgi:hypothetical protein